MSESATPWTAAHQASMFPHYLPQFVRTHVHWVHDAIQTSHALSLCSSCPQPFQAPGSFPMSWFFHQVANALELQLNHQSFQWIPRVDFCRTDRFDLPAVQGTLKGFLQHYSSKAIILWGSAFSHVQISRPYMTTGKPITLTIWTFVGKLMSLLYNMLSTFVTAFLPRSKHLLISWLQSLAAVSFEAQENKVCHCFYFLPIYLNEVIGLNVMIFIFWMLSLKPAFLLFSFTFINRLFSSSSLSAIRVVWSYLKLLIFLPAILIQASASFSIAFHVMYPAYKLNKQGDNIQPWCTFPILNQSIVPSLVQTVASWPAYRFLRRQVRWSSTPISLRIFHDLLWSTKDQKKQ